MFKAVTMCDPLTDCIYIMCLLYNSWPWTQQGETQWHLKMLNLGQLGPVTLRNSLNRACKTGRSI